MKLASAIVRENLQNIRKGKRNRGGGKEGTERKE